MGKSIKKNFIYNLIFTISGLLFPLITFPYVSRILMADGLGLVQFYRSIINYIVLFSSIGIPLYGINEIARVRDNKEDLSRTTIELITLGFILSLVGYLVVAVLCFTVGEIKENIPLFLVLSTSILITSIGCPWFYSGIEDFKYISIAGIIFRALSVFFLFCFVRTKDDILFYGLYTVIGSIGNYIFNFVRLRKYISFRGITLKGLNCWRHVKPAAIIFLFGIVTNIYLNLDSVMLGFLSSATAVGYYSAASTISHIMVTLVASLGTVLLPRSSNLIKNNQLEEFYSLSQKSYSFVLLMAFPLLLGVIVLSPSIITIFCGPGFVPSHLTLRIISPIILFIGISNLIGMQMLYPLGKIKWVTISTCIGAGVNVVLNLLLIPSFAQYGAALATACAEMSVAIAQIFMVRRLVPFPFITQKLYNYFLSSILMGVICFVIMSYLHGDVIRLIIIPMIGAIIYGGMMLITKDELSLSILSQLKEKLPVKQ